MVFTGGNSHRSSPHVNSHVSEVSEVPSRGWDWGCPLLPMVHITLSPVLPDEDVAGVLGAEDSHELPGSLRLGLK